MNTHPSLPPTRSTVARIAGELAAAAVPWELATGESPTERCYELIRATAEYDAWLIHWPVGTGLDLHDHGGSTGAFSVVCGELDEDTPGRAGGTRTRRVVAGDTVSFGDDHVHAVVNRGTRGATSVHVYAPPLRAMGFYEPDRAGRLTVARVDELNPS